MNSNQKIFETIYYFSKFFNFFIEILSQIQKFWQGMQNIGENKDK